MTVIPAWVKLAALAGAVVLVVAAVHYRDGRIRADATAAADARWIQRDLDAAQDAAKERQRRLARLEDANRATHTTLLVVAAGKRRADDAAGQLQRDLDAFTAAARRDPAADACRQAAGDPIGVLADVLGRADRRAGILAAFADDAHAAGKACEREHDALTGARP